MHHSIHGLLGMVLFLFSAAAPACDILKLFALPHIHWGERWGLSRPQVERVLEAETKFEFISYTQLGHFLKKPENRPFLEALTRVVNTTMHTPGLPDSIRTVIREKQIAYLENEFKVEWKGELRATLLSVLLEVPSPGVPRFLDPRALPITGDDFFQALRQDDWAELNKAVRISYGPVARMGAKAVQIPNSKEFGLHWKQDSRSFYMNHVKAVSRAYLSSLAQIFNEKYYEKMKAAWLSAQDVAKVFNETVDHFNVKQEVPPPATPLLKRYLRYTYFPPGQAMDTSGLVKTLEGIIALRVEKLSPPAPELSPSPDTITDTVSISDTIADTVALSDESSQRIDPPHPPPPTPITHSPHAKNAPNGRKLRIREKSEPTPPPRVEAQAVVPTYVPLTPVEQDYLFEQLSPTDSHYKKFQHALAALEKKLTRSQYRRLTESITKTLWVLANGGDTRELPHLQRTPGIWKLKPLGDASTIRFFFGKEGRHIGILLLADNVKRGTEYEHRMILGLEAEWESLLAVQGRR